MAFKLPFEFKLPKIPPKVLEWTVYISLMVMMAGVGGGMFLWSLYEPELMKLKAKDPVVYEQFEKAMGEFQLAKGYGYYKQLNEMTDEEVYAGRYARWKKRWDEDKEFRADWLIKRDDTNEANQVRRLQKYDERIEEVSMMGRHPGAKRLHQAWQMATPWVKGLMLRETCVRLLKKEQIDSANRRNIHRPAEEEAFMIGTHVVGALPSERCDRMVHIGHEPESVARSMQSLKSGMNFYYFSLMLKQLGVSRNELYTLNEILDGMTDDFETF